MQGEKGQVKNGRGKRGSEKWEQQKFLIQSNKLKLNFTLPRKFQSNALPENFQFLSSLRLQELSTLEHFFNQKLHIFLNSTSQMVAKKLTWFL